MGKQYKASYLPYFLLYGNYEEKAEERYSLLEKVAGDTPGDILDVGCSYGFFLNVARRNGWRVKGVEMGSNAAETARIKYGLDVFEGSLEQAGFADSSFNVVTLFHVIEHARNPIAIFSEVRRILRRGGLLLLLTPNLDSVHSRLLGKRWTWLHPPDHLFYFTQRSIGLALRKSGFRVTDLRTMTVDADNLFIQLASLIIKTENASKSQVAFRMSRLFRLARTFSDQLLLPEKMICSLANMEDEIFAVAAKP